MNKSNSSFLTSGGINEDKAENTQRESDIEIFSRVGEHNCEFLPII